MSTTLTAGKIGKGTVRVAQDPVIITATPPSAIVGRALLIGQWTSELLFADCVKFDTRLSLHDSVGVPVRIIVGEESICLEATELSSFRPLRIFRRNLDVSLLLFRYPSDRSRSDGKLGEEQQ